MNKPKGVRAFMFSSMMAVLEAEERRKNGEEV